MCTRPLGGCGTGLSLAGSSCLTTVVMPSRGCRLSVMARPRRHSNLCQGHWLSTPDVKHLDGVQWHLGSWHLARLFLPVRDIQLFGQSSFLAFLIPLSPAMLVKPDPDIYIYIYIYINICARGQLFRKDLLDLAQLGDFLTTGSARLGRTGADRRTSGPASGSPGSPRTRLGVTSGSLRGHFGVTWLARTGLGVTS